RRVVVEHGLGTCAGSQPADRAAGTRCACVSRQSTVLWSRASASLADPARAGFPDDLVAPRCRVSRIKDMKQPPPEIRGEYGPFPGSNHVHGVTFDGQNVWFASGDKLNAFDPANGKTVHSIDVAADAGTAFDGKHLFQIAEGRIQKIDPETGHVLATI